jgi:hypothetical protein
MQTIQELKIILKKAKIIEKQMSEFISKPRSYDELLKKRHDLHMSEFKQQRAKILGLPLSLPDEQENFKLIILLGNISTKFTAIENLIAHPPHKAYFFKNHNNLIERLQTDLKFIREELNKLYPEPNQLDSKSPAPGI